VRQDSPELPDDLHFDGPLLGRIPWWVGPLVTALGLFTWAFCYLFVVAR
jgi:hypothetical protein